MLAVQVAENVLIGVFATVAGLALGRGILAWIVNSLIPDTFPDLGIEPALSGATLLAGGMAGVVALGLAPLLTSRRLRRMDVPSTLRVME